MYPNEVSNAGYHVFGDLVFESPETGPPVCSPVCLFLVLVLPNAPKSDQVPKIMT